MIADHLDDLAAVTSTKQACQLLGASRATRYRRLRPPASTPPTPRPAPPNALSEAERQHILGVLRSPEYCDLAPAQVWARLLDDGVYLCSISTMYRLLIAAHPGAARRIGETTQWLTLGWAAVVVGLIGAKAWMGSPAARRAYGPVWLAGTVLSVSVVVVISAAEGVFAYRDAYRLWLEIVVGAIPITLSASLFAARVAQDRLVALVADLETVGPGPTLRRALRRALADPSLDVVYLRAGSGGWIDEVGQAMTSPVAVGGRTLTPIERGGKPIAALVRDPVLLRNPERLHAAIGAAALAIDNEQLKAELRAQLLDMRASRSRIVEAGDHERRRVERNLHDGAQQRLVGLALTLRLASRRAEGDRARFPVDLRAGTDDTVEALTYGQATVATGATGLRWGEGCGYAVGSSRS